MTCDDVRAKLPLYLTGDRPDAEVIRAHLAGCPGCRADEAGLRQVRELLDAVPTPAVAPPDVAAIYRAALDRQARSARRWRRAATAGLLVAAGLLLVAVLPRLEVRANANEFAVRWGSPVAPQPAPSPPAIDPRLVAQVDDVEARTRKLDGFDAELRSLKELLLTLAADVDERDQKQKDALAELTRHLLAFEAAARDKFQQTDQANTALYNLITDKPRSEGGHP
jgi:hypothetical protein